MKQSYALVIALIVLGGCTSSAGNFVEDSSLDQAMMASNTVSRLVAIYPPAKTKIVMRQETPDTFGRNMVLDLRGRGYAVAEYVEPTVASKRPLPPAEEGTVVLQYVVDRADANLYRVRITAGKYVLTGAFSVCDGKTVSAGKWTRME